jgi:hypothetical protein
MGEGFEHDGEGLEPEPPGEFGQRRIGAARLIA